MVTDEVTVEIEIEIETFPCAVRRHTHEHDDGPCRCFTGGPAPRQIRMRVPHYMRFTMASESPVQSHENGQ